MTVAEFRQILANGPPEIRARLEILLACGNVRGALDMMIAEVGASREGLDERVSAAEARGDVRQAAALRGMLERHARAIEKMTNARAGLAPNQESRFS